MSTSESACQRDGMCGRCIERYVLWCRPGGHWTSRQATAAEFAHWAGGIPGPSTFEIEMAVKYGLVRREWVPDRGSPTVQAQGGGIC